MSENALTRKSKLLPVIGVFKLLKAASLVVAGFGLHHLLRGDVQNVVTDWVEAIRVDPHSRIAHALIAKATGLTPGQLKAYSAGTFFYAVIFTTEGTGLILRKRWAEFFTVATTVTFLPIEVYEIVEKPTAVRVAVLVVNALIAIYFAYRIKQGK